MTHDFNLMQMHRLIQLRQGLADLEPTSIVYVKVCSDYWENRNEFIQQFAAVPVHHNLVIHVNFEGLSLTHCGLVQVVQRLIEIQGRDVNKIFVFSPNSMHHDAPWPNIYWNEFAVTDEIYRSNLYTIPPVPAVDSALTWAVFVGRRTMPRIKMLFDCNRDQQLRDKCLLSLMNNTLPEIEHFWKRSERYYDAMTDWIEPELQAEFQDWYEQCPIVSVDNYSIHEQYLHNDHGENRNCMPTLSLLSLQDQYRFEVVFETMTRGSTFTPSEKTVRAIMAQKATVTYAAPGFLRCMRELGFETFGELWDESYDQLEGRPRYQAMLDIVRSVAALPPDAQIELYQRSQILCRHNYKKLLELQNAALPDISLSHTSA